MPTAAARAGLTNEEAQALVDRVQARRENNALDPLSPDNARNLREMLTGAPPPPLEDLERWLERELPQPPKPEGYGTVEGRVLLDEQPVAGATVGVAIYLARQDGFRWTVGKAHLTTDSTGTFVAAGLAAGRDYGYQLHVEAEAAHPRTVDVPALTPGEERRIEVRLEGGARVRVRVEGFDGKPLAGVRAWYRADRGEGGTLKETDSGVFEGEVSLSGPGTITAEPPPGSHLAPTTARVTPRRGEVLQVALRLGAGGSLVLRFIDSARRPVSGVRAYDPANAFHILVSDEAGTVRFPQVQPGKTRLSYIVGSASDEVDVDVAEGLTIEREVIVEALKRHVAGSVVDASRHPLAGARVEVVQPERKPPLAATTDAGGRFRFDEVPDPSSGDLLAESGIPSVDLLVTHGDRSKRLRCSVPFDDLEVMLDAGVRTWRLRLIPPPGGARPLEVACTTYGTRPLTDGTQHLAQTSSGAFKLGGGADLLIEVSSEDPPSLLLLLPDGYAPMLLRDLPPLATDGAPSMDVPLTVGATLEGQVVDQGGAPIDGTEVKVTLADLVQVVGRLAAPVASVRTDSNGRFILGHVARSSLVTAHNDNWSLVAQVRIELAEGATEKVTITLRRASESR